MININYIREKKLSILVVLFFVFALLIAGAYFLPKVLDSNSTSENGTNSAFGNLNERALESKFADAENILYELYANREEYYADFDWRTQLITAKVLEIDEVEQQLRVIMINPSDSNTGIKRPVLRCNPETTYASSSANPHTSIYKSNFDVFTTLEVNDNLHANCLDENCLTLGNFCAIVDLSYNN